MSNLLFLDIDGVIVTSRSHCAENAGNMMGGLMTDYDKTAANFICNFCEAFCYEIVISSTWRHHPNRLFRLLNKSGMINYLYSPQDITKSFTPELRWSKENLKLEEQIEQNPNLVSEIAFSRGLEIKRFLESIEWDPNDKTLGGRGDRAVIIDDDSFDLTYWVGKPNVIFVHADCQNGITAKNMREMLVFEGALKENKDDTSLSRV